MKKLFIIIICNLLFFGSEVFANSYFSSIENGKPILELVSDTLPPTERQLPDTTNLTLDLLKVPASPAFTLLGISPTVIDEPKSPGDFILSLNNATEDFTKLPRSYAVEFSPAWVFGKRDIDFSELISNELGQNLKQSFIVSFGINPVDNPLQPPGNMDITQVGIGVKASLVRGRVASTFSDIDSMYHVLAEVNDSFRVNLDKWLRTDKSYRSLEDSLTSVRQQLQDNTARAAELGPRLGTLAAQLNSRSTELLQDTTQFQQQVTNRVSSQLAFLKRKGSQLKFARHGFKLDVAGGFVTDFSGRSFDSDSTQVSRIGAWMTGGWTFGSANSEKMSSILGVLRLTGNPDQLFLDNNTLQTGNNLFFDFGGRLIFHNGDRLSISGEIVGRMPLDNDALKNTSRYTVNFEYQVNPSIVLTLNLGKDFNGVITNEGNLLTALHLFTYFGKQKFDNTGTPTL